MDLIREVMLVRYRELYGTTLGDPNSCFEPLTGRCWMHEAAEASPSISGTSRPTAVSRCAPMLRD